MPTQVKLAQMVDLALGTPEVGAVNFNVLHTLLHAMLRKLNMVEVQAEISEFDRDFLSSSKNRQISGLSDLDSGKGDDSEDALSEKSSSAGPGPRKSTPYHRLEVKVEKISEQLEQFNSDLPKYKELFEKSSDTPVADIWKYIQMHGDVETNKKGLAEVWKIVQEMMENMKRLQDENKKLLEKIDGLNTDDLFRRLKELENKTNELNEKFNQLPEVPSPEEWAQFVTWPGLEDALMGVKKDWENLQPPERVVIEMSSQTEPASRPASSRPGTRMSSPGPSTELLDILEKLGNLTASHEALTKRVEDLEEEMKNKLDKSALENLDLSADLLQQLGKVKEDLDALALAREKSGGTGSVPNLLTMLKASSASRTKKSKQGPVSESEGSSSENETVVNLVEKTSSEILEEIHRQELQAIAIDSLNHKMAVLEDRFKLFQDLIMDDSAYQSQVSDLTAWLETQKNRPDPLAGIYPESESDLQSESKKEDTEPEKKPETKPIKEEGKPGAPIYVPEERSDESKERNVKFEQEIVTIFETQYQDLAALAELPPEQSFSNDEMATTNNKLRTLAFVLNDQLHTVRDKIFTLDHELKRMAKGVEFALLRAKVAGMNDLDSDALSRAQQAILQLQAEVEKLHTTTKDIIEENNHRSQQIQNVFQYCDKLQDTKADKEYVQMEVDVKADKRSLDNKVNHSLFDSTTNDINRMIKEILDKLAGNEESWNSTIKKFAEDIDGKLDRLELDPLKEWLESRLKALNDKLRKQQAQVEWTEDDAAGIRKQLIQRFHCISCDRPVDLVPTGPVPALPTRDALPPTRSPRPYTTFELDQIRQHAKRGPRNNINFERAIAEKQLARMRKSDLKAFLVHFGRDLETFRQQREAAFASTEVSDYYATTRPCGGSHTTTYPHKRITRLSHLSHLFREDEGTVYPIYKEEVDVQGADGHIYKGRMGGKLEAKLPIVTQDRSKSPIPLSQRRTTVSPPPGHRIVHQQRPTSARITPRRPNNQGDSRPQSAHPGGSRQGTPVPDQSPQPVSARPESPNVPDIPPVDQAPIEVPISGES